MLKAVFWKYPGIPFSRKRNEQMNRLTGPLTMTALLVGLLFGYGGSDVFCRDA
jgi:hypothetical protein